VRALVLVGLDGVRYGLGYRGLAPLTLAPLRLVALVLVAPARDRLDRLRVRAGRADGLDAVHGIRVGRS
jgi:hypothetical protein